MFLESGRLGVDHEGDLYVSFRGEWKYAGRFDDEDGAFRVGHWADGRFKLNARDYRDVESLGREFRGAVAFAEGCRDAARLS